LCVGSSGCEPLKYPANEKFPNVKVQFVNQRTGWIVGPRLLRTLDGGNSWQKLRLDGPGTIVSEVGIYDKTRFQFIDEHIGFALERDGVIHKTADGGETWTEVKTPTDSEQTPRFRTICFLSEAKGWLFGKEVYRTADSGQTWTRLGPAPPEDYGRIDKPRIADYYDPEVWFFNDQNGLLVKRDGDIFRTEDGGSNWQRVWSANAYVLGLHFINDKDGWLVGAKGFVCRTRDGGVSWEKLTVPTNAQLQGVYFLNEKQGWAVGMDGAIVYTTDGGENWFVANNSGTNSPLISVHFIDENRGWAVGGNYFDDIDFQSVPSNLIIETRDGGRNWTPQK
jgi:photosystem II stability/assembly factor-like uncharacterized protein